MTATTTATAPTDSRPAFHTPEWEVRRRAILDSKLHKDLKKFVADAERLIGTAFAMARRVESCPATTNPFGCLAGNAVGELDALGRVLDNCLGFFRGEL